MAYTRRAITNQSSRAGPSLFRPRNSKVPKLGDSPSHGIECGGLDLGVSSQQGRRPYQEDEIAARPFIKVRSNNGETIDTHFFALFDGHAGGRCSKFLSTSFADALVEDSNFSVNLMQSVKRVFYTINERFLQMADKMKLHDGSTGICCVIRNGRLIVANVGDCRCLVLSAGKPIQMSVDQKPTSVVEQRRIASLGGTVVYCMGIARVNGVLAVSRAFGNRTLRSVIRPDPEMSVRELTKDDDFLIMASDGLWDVLRNTDVCMMAYNCVQAVGQKDSKVEICQYIAEELVNCALSKGSLDNVTCIVVRLSGVNGLYEMSSATGGASENTTGANGSVIPDQAQFSQAYGVDHMDMNGYSSSFGSNFSQFASNAGSTVADVLSKMLPKKPSTALGRGEGGFDRFQNRLSPSPQLIAGLSNSLDAGNSIIYSNDDADTIGDNNSVQNGARMQRNLTAIGSRPIGENFRASSIINTNAKTDNAVELEVQSIGQNISSGNSTKLSIGFPKMFAVSQSSPNNNGAAKAKVNGFGSSRVGMSPSGMNLAPVPTPNVQAPLKINSFGTARTGFPNMVPNNKTNGSSLDNTLAAGSYVLSSRPMYVTNGSGKKATGSSLNSTVKPLIIENSNAVSFHSNSSMLPSL